MNKLIAFIFAFAALAVPSLPAFSDDGSTVERSSRLDSTAKHSDDIDQSGATPHFPFTFGDFGPYYVPDGKHEFSEWEWYKYRRQYPGIPKKASIATDQDTPCPPAPKLTPAQTQKLTEQLLPLANEFQKTFVGMVEKFYTTVLFDDLSGTCLILPNGTVTDIKLDHSPSNGVFDFFALESLRRANSIIKPYLNVDGFVHCHWILKKTEGKLAASLEIVSGQKER